MTTGACLLLAGSAGFVIAPFLSWASYVEWVDNVRTNFSLNGFDTTPYADLPGVRDAMGLPIILTAVASAALIWHAWRRAAIAFPSTVAAGLLSLVTMVLASGHLAGLISFLDYGNKLFANRGIPEPVAKLDSGVSLLGLSFLLSLAGGIVALVGATKARPSGGAGHG